MYILLALGTLHIRRIIVNMKMLDQNFAQLSYHVAIYLTKKLLSHLAKITPNVHDIWILGVHSFHNTSCPSLHVVYLIINFKGGTYTNFN